MEALKFRILTKDDEIEIYLKKFESFVGVKLPYDYSIRSKIVAAFKDDDMVGGYMLITKPKFRSLMFVPDAAKEQDAFFKKDDYEMMEINGVWMSAKLKSAADQYQIWISLIWDTFLSRKKYVLLMADLRNGNVRNIHSLTNPRLLYEGPPMLMAGVESHSTIRVSVTTRWQMVLNIPRYWMEYKSRERRFHKRLKEREFSRRIKQI
jgi:hypothetical protein